MKMKKIALIEDRYKRQLDFLEQNGIDFEIYEDVLENFVEEKASNLLENIINDSFDLQEYDIIVCHKSVQYDNKNSEIIGNLRDYCTKYHKTLVLFSGGISVNYYDSSEFELLELNSKTFYSHNLTLFLDALKTGNEDILMLCYGEKWKQNIVANVLEKTNRLVDKIKDKEVYIKVANFIGIEKLSKVDYHFYNLEIENNRTTKNEIEKFRDSVLSYFQKSEISLQTTRTLKIHHNNVVDTEFNDDIKFEGSDDIDTYISNSIIKELASKEFDTIFIKDNLSTNYLELYGLRVAHHIRVSNELGEKRFAPIVIISDFDSDALNKFTQEANILFTDGVYLCKNTKESILHFQTLELRGLAEENYHDFLRQIKVLPPKDTSGSHNIANKWSIYRWAEFLKVDTDATKANKAKIENMLYFKYLKALHEKDLHAEQKIVEASKKGKVLLIDDEWAKGWADILKVALTKEGLEFSAFDYDFKDKSSFNLIVQLNHKELKKQIAEADVVVLDLRLLESDHENEDIDNYSGIKILQEIHKINAGIQVIMLTATSKSTILEKLYENKILGYIKKEHPEDKSIDTVENINKFIKLVNKGLSRKYLKEIYTTKEEIKEILSQDIFAQYTMEKNLYEKFWIKLEKESTNIFDILETNGNQRFIYAMVSMASSLETILSIFVKENKNADDQFWDEESFYCTYKSLNCKLQTLFGVKLGYKNDDINLKNLIDKRNDYLHSRKVIEIHPPEIQDWFVKLKKMIQIIQNPPELKIFKKGDINNLKK